jgi:lipoprotein-anchoring transpeptidase ErfK/SrfK
MHQANLRAAQKSGGCILALVFLLAELASAQTVRDDNSRIGARVRRQVLVSLADRKLAVLEDGRVVRTFDVSVGAPISPSPTGEFQIVSRVTNPVYYHPGVVISPGAANPIGPRWIGLNRKGYGIHGTNEPRSIGRAASHGCIRLRNADIKQLFTMVHIGDVVEIRAERDQQIAQIFGGPVVSNSSDVAELRTTAVLQNAGQ